MKYILKILIVICLARGNICFAQFSDVDKLGENIIKIPPIDTASTNQTVKPDKPSVLMPHIKGLYEPYPTTDTGYSKDGCGLLVTKGSEKETELGIKIESHYIDRPESSIYFTISIPTSGVMSNFHAAYLFLAATNLHVHVSSFIGPSRPTAIANVYIPLFTQQKSDTDDKYFPLLRFTIPKNLAEIVYLQLDCTFFSFTDNSKSPEPRISGKFYSLQLKTYIPPIEVFPPEDQKVEPDNININIEI